VRLSHLLQFADLIVAKERQAQDVEEIWEAIALALAQALDSLEIMRGNEGAALAEETLNHLEQVIKTFILSRARPTCPPASGRND
jgi:uncharacterized protein YicC (UPF0701 family)